MSPTSSTLAANRCHCGTSLALQSYAESAAPLPRERLVQLSAFLCPYSVAKYSVLIYCHTQDEER